MIFRKKVISEKLEVYQLSKNFLHFTQPDISLPCSKQPPICLYPQPETASARHVAIFP
jgi:hypothetical protein